MASPAMDGPAERGGYARGQSPGINRTEQAGDGPGQRALIDRHLGAWGSRLVRRMCYFMRQRLGPIR